MAKNAVNYTGLIPEVGDSFESATINTTGSFEGIDTKIGIIDNNITDMNNDISNVDNTSDLTKVKVNTYADLNTTDKTIVGAINETIVTDSAVNGNIKIAGVESTVYTHPNHSGDIVSTGDGDTTIQANVVDNTKLAQMPTMTIKGNDAVGSADPQDLTVSEVQTMIQDATHRFVTDSQISQWNSSSSLFDTFVELTDTPSTYTGQENKYVRVNSTADGLEFTEGIATTRIIEASGTGLSVSNGDGANGNPTITSNATAVNTPNTIVARDSTGHFVTRLITATLKGKADTADKLKTSRNIGIMTGDVISVGSTFDGSANNSNDNIIANNVVDNDKLADMPTKTLKGNDTLITDNPKDLTVSEVQTMITDSTHRFVTDSQISQWNSSSSLVDTFVELTDTPSTYVGQENKYVRVNPTADGLEFIEGTGGGVASFTQLNDVPTSYVGQANKMVTVNDSETGLDFTDMPIIPTKTSDLTNDSNFIDDSSYIHTDNNYTTIEKTKLSTIEENANNYVLPSNVVIDENYVHTDTNYTQTEKTKLSGIMDGAEVNVQADWNTTDVNDDSFIKNKPTIVDTFLELDDTPTSYSGNADKVIAVNSTGTGLTFVDGGSGGGFTPISMYKAINTLADIGRADGQMSWFANPNVNQGGVYLTKLSPTLYDVSFYFRYNYVTTSTSLTAGQTITLTFAIDTGLGSTFSSYLQRKLPTEGKFQYQQGVCISSVSTVVGDFYIENGIININYYIKNNQTAARTLSQLGFVGPNWYSGRMILDLGTGDLTPLSL